jgi:uncharacterized protein (UPF0335 family)
MKHKEELLPEREPGSLTELAPIIKEFVDRLKVIEHEEENLREQKKELVEEFSDKLDTKTLKAALRLVAIKEKVQHKDTFDKYTEVLERESI